MLRGMSKSAWFAILPLAVATAAPVARADGDSPAPPPVGTPLAGDDLASLKQQLSETQERLDAALRSYTLLQDEHDKLKDESQKEADRLRDEAAQEQDRLKSESDRQIAALKAQVLALSDQVRQLRDQVADLAAENANLKTRLVLAGPPPGGPAAPPARANP